MLFHCALVLENETGYSIQSHLQEDGREIAESVPERIVLPTEPLNFNYHTHKKQLDFLFRISIGIHWFASKGSKV